MSPQKIGRSVQRSVEVAVGQVVAAEVAPAEAAVDLEALLEMVVVVVGTEEVVEVDFEEDSL